ncbi:MAG TPA: ABC transporter permease [Candidatus Eremiobacteraceae bacterium]|jgi:ribose/xylose/arabinose/galactoside ABC-type transport system permease subunit|nr:ABC transporter permease [Candidatus Eremiobacteraceae bacterium]
MAVIPPPPPQAVEAGEAAAAQAAAKARRGAAWRAAGLVAGLAVLLTALNALTHGDFLAPGNVVNVLRQISVNAILAAGQTFVIITAGIDLSVGSLIALTGVLMAGVLSRESSATFGVLLATLVGVGVGGAAGTINGLPVVRFNLPPFITTLAMMLMARGAAFLFTGGSPIEIDNDKFNFIGSGFVSIGHLFNLPGIPVPVIVMLAVVLAGHFVLTRTRFGRYVYAIGGNEEAARLSGVNVFGVKLSVYIISGALAGIASLLLAARLNSGIPQSGQGYELQSIAAVVVGGTSLMGGRGSIAGTFVGALLIGMLYNLMNLLNVQSYAQEVVLGAVILAAVLLDELRKRYFTSG